MSFMPTRLRWLTRERAALAVIGFFTAARGVSYFPPLVNPDRKATHFLEQIISTNVNGVVWVTVGVLALAAIRWRGLLPVAVAWAVGLHAAWGTSFLGGQVLDDLPRAWVSALSYFCIAMLIMLIFGHPRTAEVKIQEE